jgi:molecular chaperone GrpE
MSDPKIASKGDDQAKALQAEVDRWKEVAARAQADLQNAKSRMEKDRAEMGKFASEETLLRLLPTLDNFQRAFGQIPADLKDHEWVKGVQAIEQELMGQTSALGLRRMQSLGQIADPIRHEVLTVGPGGEGKVIEVFEEGYELHGKPLRHAKVRVGDGSTAQTPPPSPQNS